jgi:hypothetical protein
MSSPTSRTLNWLRKVGYTVGVVEKFNSFTKQRIDLFGFIDIVAIDGLYEGCLGVQATSGSNAASRRTKIISLDTARRWLAAKNRIWVVGWSKKGAKGKRKLWTPSVSVVTLEDFE